MTSVINEVWEKANAAYREGRLEDAERLCRIVLQEHPNNPLANFGLGQASVAAGRPNESLRFFESALLHDPNHLQCWQGYMDALLQCHRFDQARDAAQRMRGVGLDGRYCDHLEKIVAERHAQALVDALSIAYSSRDQESISKLGVELTRKFPHLHYGWRALGALALSSRNPAEALKKLDQADRLNPGDADTLRHKASAQRSLGLIGEAEASYIAAISSRPDFVEALHELGTLLISSGRFAEAEMYCRKSIALNPSFAYAHISLGVALERLDKLSEAKHHFSQATVLSPRDSAIHYNFGRFLQLQDDLDAAELEYRLALDIDPNNMQALINLGETLKDLGKCEEALSICDRAVAKDPAHARAHWNRSLQRLRLGLFREGWQEYEWRWRYSDFPSPALHFAEPVWLGEGPLSGKTILVHSEQGLGDTIHFCRYIAPLADGGATVLFAPQRPLASLMKGLPTKCEIVDLREKFLRFDCHVPLMSLPLALRTDLNSVPGNVPYLEVDSARVELWQRRMNSHGLKIGICWQGNVGPLDRGRSFSIAHFLGISKVPGVRLFSLVKGADHPRSLPEGMSVDVFGAEFDAGPDAFLDTAAVMKVCDLVITSDTAIAHLGGALGVPTWVALKSVPDWRWMLGRSDSPWYPSMRLFRQKSRGDWTTVFAELESAVKALV